MKRGRFEEVFSKGAREVGRFVRMHALPGSGQIGFTTSRSIGNRPRRNRVRRQMQAAIQANAELDIVVLGQRNAEKASFEELRGELNKQMEALAQRWENASESGS